MTRSAAGLKSPGRTTPTKWSNNFFKNLFGYEWELTKSPAGAYQWKPKDGAGAGTVPDAHDPSKRHAPSMLTTDLSLRFDPAYEKISRRFFEHPDQFADAFARAWFKLTHRDMGPVVAISRSARSQRAAAVAGPDSCRRSSADRGAGHCRSEGQDPRVRIVHLPTGDDGLGVGVDVPRQRQARRGERGAYSPRAAKGLGSQSTGRTGEGAARRLKRSDKKFNRCAVRREEGLAGRPDRSGRLRSRRGSCEEGRPRREGSLLAGAHGCVAGADRCGVVRRTGADRGRVPQLHPKGLRGIGGGAAGGSGATC